MILAVTTSGWGTVDVQSESRSVIAWWNSSSRLPRGISRYASYLPLAMPIRRPGPSSRKWSQCAAITRRAVGTTTRQRWIAAKMWSTSGSLESVTNMAT